MKTRREFFKTLAGSMAVVAACVVAPKSLIAEPELKAVPLMDLPLDARVATSGYAQVVEPDPLSERVTVTTTTSGAFGDSVEIKEYNHVSEWTGRTWLPYKGA